MLLPVVAVAALTSCTKDSPPTIGHPATVHLAPVGATAPVDPATWALADRLSTAAYTRDTTAALVAVLARSGIATLADPDSTKPDVPVTSPASPLQLLDFQAHALAVGTWARAGYRGAELDSMVYPTPVLAGVPTTSQLLAGYVAAAHTPGAAAARALMSGQNLLNPPALRFPAVVLLLYVADLADNADPGASATPGPSPSPSQGSAAGPIHVGVLSAVGIKVEEQTGGVCSGAAAFISRTVDNLFGYLKVADPSYLGLIWNGIVEYGPKLVFKGIGVVTDGLLATVRSIAGTVATIAEQIATLVPYAIKVTASGDSAGATFNLGPDPLPGRFTATISAGDLPAWPTVLADCAKTFDIALPDFRPNGIPLTWGPLDPATDPLLGPVGSAQNSTTTDAVGRSSWEFRTSPDPGDPTGEQRNQIDAMIVVAHRANIQQAQDRLAKALLTPVPGWLRAFVAKQFEPSADALRARIDQLLDTRGSGNADLVYHARATPTPARSGSCNPGPVPAGTYTGTAVNTFADNIPTLGGALVDHNNFTGPVTLSVATDGTLSGSWSYRSQESFQEDVTANGVGLHAHRDSTWEMTGGTFTGTACNLGVVAGTLHRLTCATNLSKLCDADDPSQSQAVLPGLGAPLSATPGHVTWQWLSNEPGGTYTDTFTITVAGPGR